MKININHFLILILFSCSNKQVLDFAHEEKFHLNKDEIALPLNKMVVNESVFLYEGFDFNLPLNKFIKSKRYNVAIHIAIDENMKNCLDALKKDSTLIQISNKKVKNYNVYFQNKNQYYLIRILYEEKNYKNPILISIYSKDSLFIQKKYEENTFVNKILH